MCVYMGYIKKSVDRFPTSATSPRVPHFFSHLILFSFRALLRTSRRSISPFARPFIAPRYSSSRSSILLPATLDAAWPRRRAREEPSQLLLGQRANDGEKERDAKKPPGIESRATLFSTLLLFPATFVCVYTPMNARERERERGGREGGRKLYDIYKCCFFPLSVSCRRVRSPGMPYISIYVGERGRPPGQSREPLHLAR